MAQGMSERSKSKEYQAAYYAKHREEKAVSNKARYDADPEKYRAKKRVNRPHKEKRNASVPQVSGTKFGLLTILEFSNKDSRSRRYYLCKCECGVEKVIHGAALVSGNTKSCGCLVSISAEKRSLPGNSAAINQLILGYKRHARDRDLAWGLTLDDVVEISSKPCAYCGAPPSNVKKGFKESADLIYSGIDRVDNTVGYEKSNCVPACRVCNYAKNNMPLSEFASWVIRAASVLSQWSNLSQS